MTAEGIEGTTCRYCTQNKFQFGPAIQEMYFFLFLFLVGILLREKELFEHIWKVDIVGNTYRCEISF